MASRKLEVEIVGDASSLQRSFGQASKAGSGFGASLASVAKFGALAVGAAGIGGIAVVLKAGISEFSQAAKVAAQTGAVLKSTGGAANVTASQVSNLAGALMRKSGVDDEAIQSGENLLLTFTNIQNKAGQGNDVFNQSTKAMLDLATAMHTGPEQAAMLLGKALNDPEKGLTKLQRSGVTFTESQKDLVKHLVETGDTLAAQKIILGEVNREFGGSAEAVGKTLPGQLNILKESFNNLAGEVVASLVPSFTQILNWTTAHWPQIEAVIKAVFNGISTAVGFLVGFVRDHWNQITAATTTAFNAVKRVAEIVWPQVQEAAAKVVLWYRGTLQPAIQNVISALQAIWARFGGDITRIATIAFNTARTVVTSVMHTIQGVIETVLAVIRGDWSGAWQGLKLIVSSALTAVSAIIRGFASIALTAAMAIGQALIDGIVAGASSLGSRLKDALSSQIHGALSAVKGVFGIHSPSDVTTKEIGVPLGEGVVQGWVLGSAALPEKMKESVRNAIEAARAHVEALRGRLSDAWSGLSSDALSAFDGIAGQLKTKSEKLLDSLQLKRRIEEMAGEVKSAEAALSAAKTDVSSLTQGEDEDPGAFAARKAAAFQAVTDAQKQLDDALFAQREFALQQRIVQERKELDARIALQRTHLAARLAALETAFTAEGAKQTEVHSRIVKLLASFGVDYKSSGQALGSAFAEGMREAEGAVRAAANALAKAAEGPLKLHSPAKEGPLSDLDTWWAKLGSTLASGVDARQIRSTLAGALSVGGAGPSAGFPASSGGGGATYSFSFPNYMGDRRELQDMVVSAVVKANRRGSLRASDLT